MDERRRSRVKAHKGATMSWAQGQCGGEVADISMKGCLIRFPETSLPEAGTDVAVIIHLQPDAHEFDVRTRGRVIRLKAGSAAVDFREITPASFPRLLRFVQLNADDPERIQNELTSPAFV
jgi:hypothetical protein